MGQDGDATPFNDGQMPSCAVLTSDGAENTCDVCQEPFQQFYNEETEEWHLRPAVRVEDRVYHPTCYDDYKASLTLDRTESGISDDLSTKEDAEGGSSVIDTQGLVSENEEAVTDDKKGNGSVNLRLIFRSIKFV